MLAIRFILIGFAVWFSGFAFIAMLSHDRMIAVSSLAIALTLIIIDSIVNYLAPRKTTRAYAQGEYCAACNLLKSDPLYFSRSRFD